MHSQIFDDQIDPCRFHACPMTAVDRQHQFDPQTCQINWARPACVYQTCNLNLKQKLPNLNIPSGFFRHRTPWRSARCQQKEKLMRCLLMLWHWLLSAISRNQPCTRIERKRCLLIGENPTATTGNKPRLQSLCRARSRAKRCPGSRADGGVAGTRETGCRVTERDVRRRRDTERSGVAAQVCESACALPAPPCQRARPPLGGPGPPRGGPPREPLSARRRRRSPFSIGWEGLWPRQRVAVRQGSRRGRPRPPPAAHAGLSAASPHLPSQPACRGPAGTERPRPWPARSRGSLAAA